MNPFSWLRRLQKGAAAARRTLNLGGPPGGQEPGQTTDPLESVHWTPAAENPFGVDVLDCAGFAQSMVSVTSSAEIAMRFTQLRSAKGEHCQGKEPGNTVTRRCHLEYPFETHRDGPVFLAEQMEDKWDIFLFDGDLYFARSWTGDLVYRASVSFEQSNAVVTQVRGQRDEGAAEDPVAVVDFLIKSHVYGLVAAHPLPNMPQTDARDLAHWSFARYGRRGLFGTNSDVTHLAVIRNEDGRCRLALQV
jgi:hypothetical protein